MKEKKKKGKKEKTDEGAPNRLGLINRGPTLYKNKKR